MENVDLKELNCVLVQFKRVPNLVEIQLKQLLIAIVETISKGTWTNICALVIETRVILAPMAKFEVIRYILVFV